MLNAERLEKFRLSQQLRVQKIAAVMRDHKIGLFRTRERELEQQITVLEVVASRQLSTEHRWR